MTFKGHNALWYANRAVLWLNYDDTIGYRALATFYRLSVVVISSSAAVWPQFLMEGFKL